MHKHNYNENISLKFEKKKLHVTYHNLFNNNITRPINNKLAYAWFLNYNGIIINQNHDVSYRSKKK